MTSSGNEGKRVIGFPNAYNGVVSVAASDSYDRKTSFSTSGFYNSVAAPGEMIYSTYYDGGYEFLQGTSMASPYVAGAAALLLSKDPTLTPLQIKNQIEQTARGNGFTEGLGYGILDIQALLGPLQPMTYGSLTVTSNLVPSANVPTLAGSGVITVFDAANNLVGFGTTGEDGSHKLWALKGGNYRVEITYYDEYAENYQTVTQTANVSAGSNATVDFQLTAPIDVVSTNVLSQQINESTGVYEIPIPVVQERLYEFITDFDGEECDTEIYIYDVNGNLIAHNDDYLDRYSRIMKRLAVGDYTVVVQEYGQDEPVVCRFDINELTVVY